MSFAQKEAEKKPTLLTIDDDPNQLLANKSTAETLGFNVISVLAGGGADNGRITASAYKLTDLDAIIKEHGPAHIIMSDFDMPGFNGQEVIEHIRSREGQPRKTPALLMSGNDTDETTKAIEALGSAKLLLKPMNRNSLGDAFDEVMGNRRGSLRS